MTGRIGRVRTVRIIVLLTMAAGLLGFGSLLCRRLINASSDFGFGALYVLVPLVCIVVVALFVAAFRIGSRKDY